MIQLMQARSDMNIFYLKNNGKNQLICRWIRHHYLETLVDNVNQFGIKDDPNEFDFDFDDILIKEYNTIEDFLLDHAELLI